MSRKDVLSASEKSTVEVVVQACRREDDDEGPISRSMRRLADEQAQEILEEDYGIVVSLARIARVA